MNLSSFLCSSFLFFFFFIIVDNLTFEVLSKMESRKNWFSVEEGLHHVTRFGWIFFYD